MRRIPLSRRSHVTGFQPARSGAVDHESALERDFVTLTRFLDRGVTRRTSLSGGVMATPQSSGPTSVYDLRSHSLIYGTGRKFKGNRHLRKAPAKGCVPRVSP